MGGEKNDESPEIIDGDGRRRRGPLDGKCRLMRRTRRSPLSSRRWASAFFKRPTRALRKRQGTRRRRDHLYRPDLDDGRRPDRSDQLADRPESRCDRGFCQRHGRARPALKKAMDRGIKVISWDSGVGQGRPPVHLNPSSAADRQHDHQAPPQSARRRRVAWLSPPQRRPTRIRGSPNEEGPGQLQGINWSPPSMATTWPTSPIARRKAHQSHPNLKGHHSGDLRRHRRRGQAVTRTARPRSAQINVTVWASPPKWPTREVRRLEVVRHLESDRPRLFGNDDRLRPHQRCRSQARARELQDGPHGHGQASTRTTKAPWPTRSSMMPRTSRNSRRSSDRHERRRPPLIRLPATFSPF